MGSSLAKPEAWQLWRASKKIEVVAAFEDATTRARVQEFCQTISRELGDACAVVTETWPSSELRMRQLCAIAAREAARADLVIVSVLYGESLPEEVQHWLDLWTRERPKAHAVLLALTDPPFLGPSSSIVACLRELAKRKQMDFLVQSDDSVQRS